MHALQQMAMMFFLIQFLVVFVALVAATRLGDPQLSLSTRKSARGVRVLLPQGRCR
jgi:hypothetical protein